METIENVTGHFILHVKLWSVKCPLLPFAQGSECRFTDIKCSVHRRYMGENIFCPASMYYGKMIEKRKGKEF